ncbi:acyl-CoA N-acyltransferase [Dioszegia hungarica]|uniref:Acyl-CoA N-acyltransferase n=1 Tax=Dioszegia hungarica TaxID=4972 RepID=A0AA38H7T1_9TREE|nr:acyl-CoA N-acyltransferase [Dioszegia hungarica]KAI9635557.1 acyl-CoA N-acyltransferase [Dioszegia hungarica]
MSAQTYTFRQPQSSDAPALSHLYGSVWAHFFAYSVSPSDLEDYLSGPLSPSSIERDIADPTARFLLATTQTPDGKDTIIGAVQLATGMSEPCLAESSTIHLRRLYIDMAHHGSGLAGDLMARTEEMARKEGYRSLWLGVWEDNKRGRRFYEKMGFVERGQKYFMVGESRRRDLVLEKTI